MNGRSAIVGLGMLAAGAWMDAAAASTASYTVTFDATWSQQTHPGKYPPGAHFSPLIGGVHNGQVAFWAPGALASPGIESMAEVGGTTTLRNEVQAAITAGTASAVLQGGGVNSPGNTSFTFQASTEFPLVTLVTMVAPTPDWFVGVHGFDLRDGGGWKNHATVDLFGYDAGTEEGVNFSLSNPATVPPQPIALLRVPFAPTDPRLGTFTFTRNFPGRPIGDYDDNGTVDAADFIVWRDSYDQLAANHPADGDLDGRIDNDDYAIWLTHFGQNVSTPVATEYGPQTATVPEPATALLALAGVGAMVSTFGRARG
jgi:hypothetical protein